MISGERLKHLKVFRSIRDTKYTFYFEWHQQEKNDDQFNSPNLTVWNDYSVSNLRAYYIQDIGLTLNQNGCLKSNVPV